MTISNTEVAIIGGGAAGIAAGRRLADARVDCLIVEARLRLRRLRRLRLRRLRVVRDYRMFDRREAPQYYPEVARPETSA